LLEEPKKENVEPEQERYFFSWVGRENALRDKELPPKGILENNPEASTGLEKTKNLFIEGDNLEVLKILQASLQNRVKMIYIDPPYNVNSGQQLYMDDFRGSRKNNSAKAATYNKSDSSLERRELSGRSHSRWLSLMYPRLFLARKLLREDGVMFVSIDDTEVHNLRMIMNEVFGEDNVETMIWRKVESNEGKLKLVKRFRMEHEYILVGYRDKDECSFKKVSEFPHFRNPTENVDHDPRGDWVSGNMSSTEELSVKGGKNFYSVISPGGKKFTRKWKFPKTEFDRLNQDHRIYWGTSGNNVPRLKVFSTEPRMVYVSSVVEYKGTAKSAASELAQLLGTSTFTNPKPVRLIQHLIDAAQTQNGIILDFFAGSGTTAEAVLAQNAQDGGNRSFILVQLPEKIRLGDMQTKYLNIAEITRARIAAVIQTMEKSEPKDSKLDLGMKVFKLRMPETIRRRD
jgi:adenine-specific DNA-methyltransferase